ncbi:acyl-CoA dehydrogenase family protein [Pseudomonadales bacterium]|nr:pimeloyl-CoA dehydrogenase small subunit [Gammaproteobacteria bacterium]MDA0825210.1 acyl-CoA dehydrogenase family protein [Pseudomonadota bacterium]MDB2509889.1 acyl-CoA dehydrogenase family protein [Pseudomonadales bacterium]MCH9820530.1 acyl-CoA dehydrogenase family protein [Gammaproteobacteria bacterium]MCO4830329.1 acyl-CoA dehydrogenase family protein [Gammaproteobacteria bacterium]
MDFSFSDEQNMLEDSVQRFIQNNYGFDARQKIAEGDEGFSRALWAQFADMGWLGLPFSEEDGGFGGTAVETMILLEAFGKGLVVEPYISAVLQAGMMIAKGGTSEQKQAWLEPLIAGTSLPAVAYIEPQARFNVNDVKTTATAQADGYSINGFKGVVLGGPFADLLIVPARTSGNQSDAEGITLFVIDAKADGVSRRDYPTIDGFRASEITLTQVSVTKDAVLGSVDQGLALLQYGLDQGMMGAAAEAVGAMEVLYKSTVEYCKTREQFGQPIGKFQVLQHRMVDMFIEHEQTKSLAFMAAMKLAEGYNDASRKALSALKVQVGKGGTMVGQQAVQLHGGMGMTNELNIGHYFKRLTAIETLYGNTDFHLKRYASL